MVTAVFAVATGGAAEDFASPEAARAVLEQVEREAAQIDADHQRATQQCAGGFLVNACVEQAGRERDRRKREVRAREVSARDALRRFAALEREQAREQRRTDAAAKGSTSEARREPSKNAAALHPRTEPKTAVEPVKSRRQTEASDPAAAEQRRIENERRAEAHAVERKRRAAEQAEKAALSAGNRQRYEERQRAAEARQQEKARLADKNAERRERRRLERERAAQDSGNAARK